MPKHDANERTDDHLWNLVQEHWPESDAEIDTELLAAYVDDSLSENDRLDFERVLAFNPSGLEAFVALRELASMDEQVESRSMDESAFQSRADSSSTVSNSGATKRPAQNQQWIYAIAASLLALALGYSFYQGHGYEQQVASLRGELIEQELEYVQLQVDLQSANNNTPLWLGKPTAFYGSPSIRMRGAPSTLDLLRGQSFYDLGSQQGLTVDQRLWLAELKAAAGALDDAEQTLQSIDPESRDHQWELTWASILIVKLRDDTDAWDGADVTEAKELLTRLQKNENLRPKVLFNLAALRVLQGRRLRESDFAAARDTLRAALQHLHELTKLKPPPSVIQAAETLEQTANALLRP